MAEQVTLVPLLTPPTQVAASDYRGKQYFAVQVNNTLTVIADERSHSAPYILANAPNSGQPCTLNHPPDVARAVAAETITGGQWVKVYSATGMVGVTSQGGLGRIGAALAGTTNGSGDYIPV